MLANGKTGRKNAHATVTEPADGQQPARLACAIFLAQLRVSALMTWNIFCVVFSVEGREHVFLAGRLCTREF